MMISEMKVPTRLNYGRIPNLVETKDLISTQTDSFRWFLSDGLRELFDEINPITDYSGKNFELRFLDFELRRPQVQRRRVPQPRHDVRGAPSDSYPADMNPVRTRRDQGIRGLHGRLRP